MNAPIVTPYTPKLTASVQQLYAVFGARHLSKHLEVCRCPVCVTQETFEQIIDTPTTALSAELIRSYSHSAHGVPDNLDDLRLLLPRYLDLMSVDEMVDDIGVGTELLRFGDARRMHNDLYSKPQQEALDVWARYMLWHFSYAEAEELDNLHTPFGLLEILTVGGWDVSLVTGTLEDIFAHPKIGQSTLAGVVRALNHQIKPGRTPPFCDLFALRYVEDRAREELAAWLNSSKLTGLLEEFATDPVMDPHDHTYARVLLGLQGRFEPESFPRDPNR